MYRNTVFLLAMIVWVIPGSVLAWEEFDTRVDLSDVPISVVQLPMDLDLSIKEEDEPDLSTPLALAATEDEVEQFLADLIERYSQEDIEGLLALFSRRAIQNEKDEIDEIEKTYTSLFRKSRDLQYSVEPTRIEIYQNAVDARARYQVEQILKRSGREKVWRGEIRWILVREDGALRIRYQDDWVEESFLRERVADLGGRPDVTGSSHDRGGGGQGAVGGGATGSGDGGGGSDGGSAPGDGSNGDGSGSDSGGSNAGKGKAKGHDPDHSNGKGLAKGKDKAK